MPPETASSTRPAAIITARNVSKRYDGVIAVDGISFEVRAGECFGLLGPNGAGKTSAIRLLYGFSPVNSGSLQVFGLEVASAWRQIRSRLGVCQQDNTLDPDLSVLQNLLVFASYFRLPARVARQRAEELLAFFALEQKAGAKVGELSGGLARRLTLARALINDPELIILDEPTTGLDPQSRHLLWERLRLLRGRGKTFLLTTHYMEEAAQLCDRLVIMDHGRILVEGSPAELIRQHAGERLIELRGDLATMRQFLQTRAIAFDDLGDRLVLEDNGDGDLERAVREAARCEQCTVRAPTLEDVFLRLTGRELRE
jgi:lipooligosaccharide transport system ATP-binding protein